MFRFFRYFLVLFLLINVLPILGLLVWEQSVLSQMEAFHQRHGLSIATHSLDTLTSRFLAAQNQTARQVAQSLPSTDAAYRQAHILFPQAHIVWVHPRKGLQGTIPGLSPQAVNAVLQSAPSHIDAHFVVLHPQSHPRLATAFVLPVHHPVFRGLLVVNPVELSQLQPPGPFKVTWYAGLSVKGAQRMGTQVDPFMPSPPSDPVRPRGPLPALSIQSVTYQLRNASTPDVVATLIVQEMRPPFIQAERQKSLVLGLVILVSGALFSLLAARYLKHNVIAPMLRLSVATTMVQKGILTAQVDVGQVKQADMLATLHNFNQMVQQIAEKEDLRRNVVANLTHDLKTPLIAQSRTLGILAEELESAQTPQLALLARSLESNNANLLHMVTLLLETYQLEAGNIPMRADFVDLSALLSLCVAQVAPLAHDPQITITTQFASDLPAVWGDADQLRRVFINLLSNAIENNPKGCQITVSTSLSQDKALVHVRDNGVGISEESLPFIFDRYYTGSDTRQIGSGLGLYICKALVEAHHGQITAASQLGAYTEFGVTLPLRPSQEE